MVKLTGIMEEEEARTDRKAWAEVRGTRRQWRSRQGKLRGCCCDGERWRWEGGEGGEWR
jgi:hypothetical protein